MRVIATEMGFIDGRRRRKGEEFEVPEGKKAKWFTPVAQKKAPTFVVGSATGKPAASKKPEGQRPADLA